MTEELLTSHSAYGLVVGAFTFLIIGLFHPLVIKAEYHWGVRSWWGFLAVGIACIAMSIAAESRLASALLGVTAFASLWSILEVFQQRRRVRKGWFPAKPKKSGK